MKIIGTFALVDDSLYTVQYDTESTHEFAKCFNLWNDPVYLREFFEEHSEDLKHPFWRGITIEDAILKTREDAKLLEKQLLEVAETGKTQKLETLSTLFEPLSKNVYGDFEKDKAKGLVKPSWLRLYAIRVEANLFVISGGAIKLTETMNTREHLINELDKLEVTREFLRNNKSDQLDFLELH